MIDLNTLLTASDCVDLGNAFAIQKDFPKAILLQEAAIEHDPACFAAYCNQANIYYKQGRFILAKERADKAMRVATAPNSRVHNILASIAQDTGDFAEARRQFDISFEIEPANKETLVNFGYFCQLTGQAQAALDSYSKARNIDRMDMQCRLNRAMTMMLLGHDDMDNQPLWDEALSEYDVRNVVHNLKMPDTGKAMYTGQLVPAGALLIVAEQGIGDMVMMGRYVRRMKEKISRVYILCDDHCFGLFNRIADVDGVFVRSEVDQLPEYDYHVPAISLLRLEGYPGVRADNSPYLKPCLHGINGYFSRGKFKIGLAWSGSKAHENDRYRSIPMELFEAAFKDLASIDDMQFYSLQQPEITPPYFAEDARVTSLGRLGCAIGNMDLVVTIDSAPLHIAGAMGVPTIGLIPQNPDWRWGTKGETTEWYPSVRLVRSTEPLQWEPVMQEARLMIMAEKIAGKQCVK